MKIEEFERLAKRVRFSARGRETARAVLVDGKRQADVAREYGIPRQYVQVSVRAILRRRRVLGSRKKPPGWVSVTVVVPRPIARQIKGIEKEQMRIRPPLKAGRKPKHKPKPAKPVPLQVPDVAGVSAIARALLGLQIQSTTAEET